MSLIRTLERHKTEVLKNFGFVLLVHLIKIVNYFPNWDSMWAMKTGLKGMTASGRWLSGLSAVLLSSPYDLQWVEGVVSAALIALSAVTVLCLFEIRDQKLRLIAGFLFAAFPSIASTFNYPQWSCAYMLALFTAVSGVFACCERWGNRAPRPSSFYPGLSDVPCALLFMVSLGIYQIYYVVALVTFLCWLESRLLNADVKVKDVKACVLHFAYAFLFGAILYWIGQKAAMRLFEVKELATYMGISEIGRMSGADFIMGAAKTGLYFARFFSGTSVPFTQFSIYLLINVLLAVILLYFLVSACVRNAEYGRRRKFFLCALPPLIVLVTYSLNFVSPGVHYHALMEFGMYFIYFLIIVFLDRGKRGIHDLARRAAPVLLAVLCFYHFVNDNVAYHKMAMSYQRTSFEMAEVLMEIDRTETSTNRLAVVGKFPAAKERIETIPIVGGASTQNFLSSSYHVSAFANYYFGRDYVPVDDDEVELLAANDEVAEMPEYPARGFVRVIDGVIVVKLTTRAQQEAWPEQWLQFVDDIYGA